MVRLLLAAELAAVERDWLDYAELGAGVLAALVAVVALVVALRSADDAERSARASQASAEASAKVAHLAEQELELVRREALHAQQERAKRPLLDLHVAARTGDVQTLGDARRGRDPTLVDVRVRNTGTKAATGARLTFMIAPYRQRPVIYVLRQDATGSSREAVPLLETTEPSEPGGDPVEWTYATETLDLPVHVTEHRQYVVLLPGGGYPLKVRVQHAEAPNGGVELQGELGTEGFFGRDGGEAFRPEPRT